MHLIDHRSINSSDMKSSLLKILAMILGFVLVYLVL